MWPLLLFLLLGSAPQQPGTKAVGSCIQCHQDLAGEMQEPVTLAAQDIHLRNGLSCANCHGGDPADESAAGAMNPKKGYIGKPARGKIATLCASCHSNAEFMRRYNPQARIDAYPEYLTSVHGKKYQTGDPNVAVCIDCHGHHGVRAAKDANSPVYVTNVAATCGRCHSDAKRMSSYGIPTNQIQLYTSSVHGIALLKNRDLAAPTCNSCHGNHGAAPPGIDSVANVCGQCHARQWDLFNKSPHQKAFAENKLMACVTCHQHHDIAQPTDAMLGTDAKATCTMCHDDSSKGYAAGREMKAGVVKLSGDLDAARGLLQQAERAGMEVSKPLYDMAEGRDKLILARVDIHSFSVDAVKKNLQEGDKIAAACLESGRRALDDLSYRRKGFGISAAILLLMIGLLLVKIRQISNQKA
jgi:hypothetical protein